MTRAHWIAGLIVLGAGLNACAPHKEVATPKPLSPVRKLAVQMFENTGGPDVTREFVQMLKTTGFGVVDKAQNADAILIGRVNTYQPANKLMVFLGETNTLSGGKTGTVSNPVVSENGSQVLPQGPAASMNSPHVVTERAVVSVSVQVVSVSKEKVYWVSEYSYESLDLAGARRTVVSALTHALNASASQLKH